MNMTGQQECHCATYKTKGTCHCFWKMNFILLEITAVGFLIPFLMGNYFWSYLLGGSGLVILSIISGGWIHRGTNAEGVQKRSWWLFTELAFILLFLVVLRYRYSQAVDYEFTEGMGLFSIACFLFFIIPAIGVSGLARLRPVNVYPPLERMYFPVLFVLLVLTFYIFGPDTPLIVSWLVMCLWGWGILLFVRDLLTPGEQQLLKKEVMEQRWVLLGVIGLATVLLLLPLKDTTWIFIVLLFSFLLTIYNGARLMPGESNHHTLEYLITRPLSINRIFWIKYLVGLLVPLYLILIICLQTVYFGQSQYNYRILKELIILFILPVSFIILMYNFLVFLSVLFKDTVRTIMTSFIGGVIIGLLIWTYVSYYPFSPLAMIINVRTDYPVQYPIHLLFLALLSLGIVGIAFSSQLRKRLVWNSHFMAFTVIGLVCFLFYQPVFMGPMPKITSYTGQPRGYLEIRGDKGISQGVSVGDSLVKLNPDNTLTEEPLELNVDSDRYPDDFVFYSITVLDTDIIGDASLKDSVLVKKMSLDTLDKATIRVRQTDLDNNTSRIITTWHSQIVTTPRVLQSVKLPCMKDYNYSLLFADTEGIHILSYYKVFDKNPYYKQNTLTPTSTLIWKGMRLKNTAVLTTNQCLESYLLNNDDLSVISHQIRGRENDNPFWMPYNLIQGKYRFINFPTPKNDLYYYVPRNSGVLMDITKTGPEARAGRISKEIRQFCTNKTNLIYAQPNDRLLEIYDVSDAYHPRKISELSYPIRDRILRSESYCYNMKLKGDLLLMWSDWGYYVIDVSSPEKPRIISRRTVPANESLIESHTLQWDPVKNAFRLIAVGTDRLFIGDYPPITK